MWNPDNPGEWARTHEERWDAERAAAANQRLARAGKTARRGPNAIARALRYVEQKFYLMSRMRPAQHPRVEDVDRLSDEEITRLLTLLAPGSGRALAASFPESPPESDEDLCLNCG